MKNFLRKFFVPLIAAANDGEITVANAEGDAAVFEVRQKDSLFIPYGEYPHDRGMQKFTRESAEEMRAAANSLIGKSVGIPIFFGHPDVKGRPDTNPAAPARGWGQDILIENDGIRIPAKYGQRGQEAIDNAEFRFYSPHWLMKPVKGGYMPVRMLSIGLTNHPRIPVPALANDQTQNENTMKLTAAHLKLLGLDAAANDGAGPTDEQIETAVSALGSCIIQAENDAAEVTRLASALEVESGKVTTLGGDLAAANDRVTAARGLLIDASLERAVTGGKLPEGERVAKRTELIAIANDAELTTALSGLEAAKPVLKTSSALGDLTKSKAAVAAANDATARSSERQKLVDAELVALPNDMKPGARHDEAWLRAQRKRPDLFTSQANA